LKSIIKLTLTFLVFIPFAAFGWDRLSNTRDLQDELMVRQHPAKIEAISSERSCSPTNCSIDIENISIFPEQGIIQKGGGDIVRLKEYKLDQDMNLPEIDWDPIGSFKVFRDDKRWGTCLEFSHKGIGKSGRFQRWASVILIPLKKYKSKSVAYRFVGYWADCNLIANAKKSNEVLLPTIESYANGNSHFQIIWHRCSPKECINFVDRRILSKDSSSESGALLVN
jgi:hypothetical protein